MNVKESDAGKRVSVPGATSKIQQAIHPITEEYLGRDTAACWRAAFPDIRVAPYVCDPAARRGVVDHFVTQMLRQGDSQVFKRYSRAKLNLMREALSKLDCRANEHRQISSTARPN